MPNVFAYVALFSWPIVAMILFRRLPVSAAVAATIVGGYLFLPLQPTINFPVLPTIDKALVASLSAAVFAALALRRNGIPGRLAPAGDHPRPAGILDGWVPKTRAGRLFLALILVGGFMTVFLNDTALVFETRTLPALKPYDAFSATLSAIVLLLPFLIGRKYLAHPQAHVVLLAVLCIAGLIYSLPTLWEARMSPQLNRTFYGFFPDAWRQHLRAGGYRPLVFLSHGLQLGIFLCVALLATVAWSRVGEQKYRLLLLGAAAWLFVTLIISKNMGALLIGTAVLPLVFLGVRLQLLAAALIALMVLTFPVLRGTGILPSESIVAAIETIDPSRASSLQFRLDNEEFLLEKANDRPFFGWGGWGRARVFAADGRDISTTDGLWIITLGEGGWARYVGQFGLLATSIVILAFRRRSYGVTLATSGLALALAANLVDLIPNTGLTPVTWLIAGALMGRIEVGAVSAVETVDTAGQTPDPSSYRRPSRPGAATGPGMPGRQPVYRRSLTTEGPRK